MYKYRGMREEKHKYKFSSFKYQELKYSVLRSKFDQRAVQYFPPPFFVRLMYKSRCYLRNSVCQTTKNQCSDTKTGMFQYLTLTSGSDQRRAASHELNWNDMDKIVKDCFNVEFSQFRTDKLDEEMLASLSSLSFMLLCFTFTFFLVFFSLGLLSVLCLSSWFL